MYSTLNEQIHVIKQIKTLEINITESELETNYQYCLSVMQNNSKSFYFAAQSLPDDKRKGVGALYAFCRLVDDIVDESHKRAENINIILDELKSSVIKDIESQLGRVRTGDKYAPLLDIQYANSKFQLHTSTN